MTSPDNEGSVNPNIGDPDSSEVVWTAETAWATLEATPGFYERMLQANALIDAGNSDQLAVENIISALEMPPDAELIHRHKDDPAFWERVDKVRGVPVGTSKLLISFSNDSNRAEE
jgi:hypothetical protein